MHEDVICIWRLNLLIYCRWIYALSNHRVFICWKKKERERTGLLRMETGSGNSSVVRAPDSWSKGRRMNPCSSGGIIFFSRVNFRCWLFFRYPFHPRVTSVARKKCEWQVRAKYVCTLRIWLFHEVTWCIVVWCTQNAPRWQQFHVAPAMPYHLGG